MSEASAATAAGNRNPYVYVVAGISALGGLLFGYDTGVISGALEAAPIGGQLFAHDIPRSDCTVF